MKVISAISKYAGFLAILLIQPLAAGAAPASDVTTGTRPFLMGFTPFPPDFTAEAMESTGEFIRANGDIICHHFDAGVPWTEALADKPFHESVQRDWERRKKLSEGKKILLSVTPLNSDRKGMALYHGEKENLPLPREFAGKALNDPTVKSAYLNYCRRAVAHFEPDYMCIGIEVNELLEHTPSQWPQFVELYNYVYEGLKALHPNLPVFASLTLHNMTNPSWNRKRQETEIRKFLPRNDIAAISYYPFMSGGAKKSETPVEGFDWLRRLTDKPIAFTETGYPAETISLKTFKVVIPSDPAKQATYYETLLKRATTDKYLFVISFLHRDYDALWAKIEASAPEAFKVWKDCGLLDENGVARPALEVWKRYYAKDYAAPKTK